MPIVVSDPQQLRDALLRDVAEERAFRCSKMCTHVEKQGVDTPGPKRGRKLVREPARRTEVEYNCCVHVHLELRANSAFFYTSVGAEILSCVGSPSSLHILHIDFDP